MAYSTPLIARIYNRTSRSFGITIQGDSVWMYPNGETELHYDPLSACLPKEEMNLISLIKKGVISVEVRMYDGIKYNSVGYYVIDTKPVTKPVVKVQEVKTEELTSITDTVEAEPAVKEADPFTFEKVQEETTQGIDPFNVPEKEVYQTPVAETVKETTVEEAPVVKETVEAQENVIAKVSKRSKKSK